MTYSTRYGHKSIKDLAVGDISSALRNGIIDAIEDVYLRNIHGNHDYEKSEEFNTLCVVIWHNMFRERIRDVPENPENAKRSILTKIEIADFPIFYDYLEFFANIEKYDSLKDKYKIETLKNWCNSIFKRENAPLRFVAGLLVELTNELEIKDVQLAASSQFAPVSTHIQNALLKMSDRLAPDYRNSVKESVSAIEAAARIVAGNESATLGDALAAIEKGGKLHGSLKKGFSAIYGWTNQSGGIRHALSDKESVTEIDARFMVVACSAFSNYLLASIMASTAELNRSK